jgi:hypothetical protein
LKDRCLYHIFYGHIQERFCSRILRLKIVFRIGSVIAGMLIKIGDIIYIFDVEISLFVRQSFGISFLITASKAILLILS